MRIVSKFHDYYDSAQGYGQDPALIYRRTVERRVFPRWDWDPKVQALLSKRPGFYQFNLLLGVIGFCGRIYPVWFQERFEPSEATFSTNVKERSWMTEAEVDAYCDTTDLHMYSFWKLPLRLESYAGLRIDDTIFRELKAPAFIAFSDRQSHRMNRPGTLVFTNPRLATLGFVHRFDPFSAFQEIAMYLGSQLTNDDSAPRTVGSDKVIAASKGFDEASFRSQAPGRKKLNRRKNHERKNRSTTA